MLAHVTTLAILATTVVVAMIIAVADATIAVVKNAAGGNSGKTKIAATNATNAVIK